MTAYLQLIFVGTWLVAAGCAFDTSPVAPSAPVPAPVISPQPVAAALPPPLPSTEPGDAATPPAPPPVQVTCGQVACPLAEAPASACCTTSSDPEPRQRAGLLWRRRRVRDQ